MTKDRIALFREQGYAVIPDFFSNREIKAMRIELDRLIRDGLLRNVATEGDGVTPSPEKRNLQICPIAPQSRFFRSMPFQPRIIETISQLIGDPFVFYLDQIFLKPGRQGIGTNWHQDNAYFKISDPAKGVGMWTAIHDATKTNGTLHIIPGSHKETYPHDRDPNSDHHIFCDPPEQRAIAMELQAGGSVFFNFGIAHCTHPNRTNQDRAGIAHHFLRGEYIPADKVFPPLHPYLTGPKASGGLKEYGVCVQDTWDKEVDRRLADPLH